MVPLFASVLDWVVLLAVVVFMLSVLVAAHELGHYLFARLFGMGVEEFAVGFGKPVLWTYMKRKYTVPLLPGQQPVQTLQEEAAGAEQASVGERFAYSLEGGSDHHPDAPEIVETPEGRFVRETTAFTIRAWPLGGFVRIKAMMPEPDASETRVAGGFYSKPPWQRLIVLFAGPLFSVIAGVMILTAVYSTYGVTRRNMNPVIEALVSGGPAHKAGIQPGDRVVSIDGKPITRFYELIQTVKSRPGERLDFVLDRKGKQVRVAVVPDMPREASEVMGPDLMPTMRYERQAKIGVLPPRSKERVKLSPSDALREALTWPVLATTGLVRIFTSPRAFKENAGGPVSIVTTAKSALALGPMEAVQFAALLSISVGIFNLLPVTPLDGGQMMIALVEMLRGGRRLSLRVQATVLSIGAALLVTLFAAVFIIDIGRLIGQKNAQLPTVVQEKGK